MINKYKFSKYLLFLIFFSCGLFATKKLPENFYINYGILQSIKLRNIEIEKTQISSGEVKVKYKSEKKKYDLNVQLSTKKFLKFYGDKKIQSQGVIGKKGLLFNTFIVKDIKRPKKNIRVVYDRIKQKLTVDYKKKIFEQFHYEKSKFIGNLLDIPTLILQFHFEELKSIYLFQFTEGKKIKKIEYRKIKDENLRINGNDYITELYEGKVPLSKKQNSNHFVWISKGTYRIPIKVRFEIKNGLMIDLNIKKTDLVFKK